MVSWSSKRKFASYLFHPNSDSLVQHIQMLFSSLCSYLLSRNFLARIFSTLLCSILVVLRPFAKFGGSLAFLALTIKELHFPPQRNFAQQVEISILNLIGGIFGIVISLLGLYLASLTDNAALARAIPALFLTLLSFASKPRFPSGSQDS